MVLTPEFIAREKTWLRALRDRLLVQMTVEGFTAQLAASLAHDASEGLKSIDVPTLVMMPTADALIPPVASEELARLIPGATLQKFDGGSHGFNVRAGRQVQPGGARVPSPASTDRRESFLSSPQLLRRAGPVQRGAIAISGRGTSGGPVGAERGVRSRSVAGGTTGRLGRGTGGARDGWGEGRVGRGTAAARDGCGEGRLGRGTAGARNGWGEGRLGRGTAAARDGCGWGRIWVPGSGLARSELDPAEGYEAGWP
jgi:hypothetical protein